MEQALASLLPIGVAAALSSVPIMVTIVILLSHNRSRSALPFVAGWVLGTLILVSVGTIAASSIPQPRPRHSDMTAGVLEIILGAALVMSGLRALFSRGRSEGGHASKWREGVSALSAAKAFGIGLVLNIRPKGLVLSAAASVALVSAQLGVEDSAVLVVVYSAIATSTVTIPIMATIVSPQRMEPRLIDARDWLNEHGYVMTATIMVLIGAFVVGSGLSKL